MKNTTLIFSLFVLLISCESKDPNDHVDEGSFEKNIYTSEEMGWSFSIPGGWDNTTTSDREKSREFVESSIKEKLDVDMDFSQTKTLIGLKKGQGNLFQANSIGSDSLLWQAGLEATRDYISSYYIQMGMNCTASAFKEQIISGVRFLRSDFKLSAPDGSTPFEQSIFGTFRNGREFRVVINANNQADQKAIFDAWSNSEFN